MTPVQEYPCVGLQYMPEEGTFFRIHQTGNCYLLEIAQFFIFAVSCIANCR